MTLLGEQHRGRSTGTPGTDDDGVEVTVHGSSFGSASSFWAGRARLLSFDGGPEDRTEVIREEGRQLGPRAKAAEGAARHVSDLAPVLDPVRAHLVPDAHGEQSRSVLGHLAGLGHRVCRHRAMLRHGPFRNRLTKRFVCRQVRDGRANGPGSPRPVARDPGRRTSSATWAARSSSASISLRSPPDRARNSALSRRISGSHSRVPPMLRAASDSLERGARPRRRWRTRRRARA